MGTGVGVFFLAVGAVLAFATNATVSGLDLALVGSIFMLVGATSVALSMMRWAPRRRAAVRRRPTRLPRVLAVDVPVSR